ncbi:MAG: 4a-hydroxytetrahydrobiopterin dehydratase [Acidobacteria bacterium]|nr:4a-hydroxytetrahydrobiopterin dehydratase [Acidobacteriota bacterium]
MSNLAAKHCVPCHKGIPPLKGSALAALTGQLSFWRVVEEHHLLKTFLFPDFAQALEFVNRTGAVAEQEGHHPDLCLSWGKVDVKIFTHKINGLSENDFILAAKIDEVHVELLRAQ